MSSPTVDVPSYPVPRPEDPLDIATELGRLREERPIVKVRLPTGMDAWLVTSYELARQVLGSRTFSSDASLPGFPQISPVRPTSAFRNTLIRMDPPEHTRMRRLLNPEFVIRRVEAMRPEIQRIADALLDAFAEREPPADLVTGLALPLPSLVISDLIGVPPSERPYFEALALRLITMPPSPERFLSTSAELTEYMERLIAARIAEPADDMLTRMIELERTGDLTHDDVVDTGRLLLLAGHATTANMIGLGVVVLLRHPDQLRLLLGDPSLMPQAVEELLRHQTLLQAGLSRVAVADVELGGQHVAAGEGVVVAIAAANRDARLGGADDFDVTRGARGHLAFGYGFHQCLGQLLARIEIDVALTSVFRRFPSLALAVPESEIPFREDGFLHGIRSLPVTW